MANDDHDGTLVAKLRADINELENRIESAHENHARDLRRAENHRSSEITDARKLASEIFGLIEERFGRKVRQEMELDLKCRKVVMKMKDVLKFLARRRLFLENRIADNESRDLSFDKAECAALREVLDSWNEIRPILEKRRLESKNLNQPS